MYELSFCQWHGWVYLPDDESWFAILLSTFFWRCQCGQWARTTTFLCNCNFKLLRDCNFLLNKMRTLALTLLSLLSSCVRSQDIPRACIDVELLTEPAGSLVVGDQTRQKPLSPDYELCVWTIQGSVNTIINVVVDWVYLGADAWCSVDEDAFLAVGDTLTESSACWQQAQTPNRNKLQFSGRGSVMILLEIENFEYAYGFGLRYCIGDGCNPTLSHTVTFSTSVSQSSALPTPSSMAYESTSASCTATPDTAPSLSATASPSWVPASNSQTLSPSATQTRSPSPVSIS